MMHQHGFSYGTLCPDMKGWVGFRNDKGNPKISCFMHGPCMILCTLRACGPPSKLRGNAILLLGDASARQPRAPLQEPGVTLLELAFLSMPLPLHFWYCLSWYRAILLNTGYQTSGHHKLWNTASQPLTSYHT